MPTLTDFGFMIEAFYSILELEMKSILQRFSSFTQTRVLKVSSEFVEASEIKVGELFYEVFAGAA